MDQGYFEEESLESRSCNKKRKTKVPIIKLLGGKSRNRDKNIPAIIENTVTPTEYKTICLNEFDQSLTIKDGITSNAPINKPPTVFIPIQTTIANIQKKNRRNISGFELYGILYTGFWVAPISGYQKKHKIRDTTVVIDPIQTSSGGVKVKMLPNK